MKDITLKEWREGQGLTRAALGTILGVSGVSVQRYEEGSRLPEHQVMTRIYAVTDGQVQPNSFYRLGEAA